MFKKYYVRETFFALFLFSVFFSACSSPQSELSAAEESSIAEQQRLEVELEEEKSTKLKKLTSENLSDAEKSFKNFVQAIKNQDAQAISDALGILNLFTDQSLTDWIVANDFDLFYGIDDLSQVQIRSEKEGSITEISTWFNGETNAQPKKYKMQFVDGAWILIPKTGILENYTFKSPVKNLLCNDISFEKYVVSLDETGYMYNFEIPRFPILSQSPIFYIETEIGQFSGQLFDSKEGALVISTFDADQKKYLEVCLTKTFNTAFELLKSGATQNDLTQAILSERIIKECFPEKDDNAIAYKEKIAQVQSVEVYEGDIQVGYPNNYIYRLVSENAVQMNIKLAINTSLGQSRQKLTVVMQKFADDWKIIDITAKNKPANPFVNFESYNPEW